MYIFMIFVKGSYRKDQGYSTTKEKLLDTKPAAMQLRLDKDRPLSESNFKRERYSTVIIEFFCVIVVDGGWSNWSGYIPCSASCQGGIKSRLRFCTNPTPQNNGAYCPGSSIQQTGCNNDVRCSRPRKS